MQQSFLGGQAIGGVSLENPADEVLRVCADFVPGRAALCVYMAGENSLFEILRLEFAHLGVLSAERQAARQELVCDNAHAPHVGLLVVLFQEHLRRHVDLCALLFVLFGSGAELGGQPEVRDFDVHIVTFVGISHEQVGGLHVAVHVALFVPDGKHLDDLRQDFAGLLLADSPLADVVLQSRPVALLHH
eukprot:CAMPEP_0197533058 /NCGR_PEP_ID=MMETSP1318-20131121/42130_1 /TAXON_ID=552666 /ORGANISM="Partenskyella glossopodia, Strain RCC365" /LENGTH=188 /DNA_ID=CAMNT_0043089823 /DNA_START=135 /DNA_END=701 /DNA_ORIENTATION=+